MNFGFGGLLVLAFFVQTISSKDYIRACYFTNWSQHRKGIGKFTPEMIETDLCSHIIYSVATMGDDFLIRSVEKNDEDVNGVPGLYSRINSLKEKQPELKTLLSFGGNEFAKSKGPLMKKMLESVSSRAIFIRSAFVFARMHNFDGFDFDWVPDMDTKDNYAKLIKEFRDAIEDVAKESERPKFLLTAGVPAQVDDIEAGIDPKIADSLDWLNVDGYDYRSGENKTGFNMPLFDSNGGDSINSTFAYLTDTLKISKDKLVMGYATYGQGWKLASNSEPNTIPSPAIGPSPAQPYTNDEGFAAYFEICDLIDFHNYTEEFAEIERERVPYAYKDDVWIAYDNPKRFDEKLDWLIEKDLAGIFVFTLDYDDFVGHCPSSKGKYPLIKAINTKLVKKKE